MTAVSRQMFSQNSIFKGGEANDMVLHQPRNILRLRGSGLTFRPSSWWWLLRVAKFYDPLKGARCGMPVWALECLLLPGGGASVCYATLLSMGLGLALQAHCVPAPLSRPPICGETQIITEAE